MQRTTGYRIGAAAVIGGRLLGTWLATAAPPLGAQGPDEVTAETVAGWMTELSNWGRWGEDDELGTLNLVTPEKRRGALALATAGVSVSLSHTYLTEPDIEATSPGRPTRCSARIAPVPSAATATRSPTTATRTRTWTRSAT